MRTKYEKIELEIPENDGYYLYLHRRKNEKSRDLGYFIHDEDVNGRLSEDKFTELAQRLLILIHEWEDVQK